MQGGGQRGATCARHGGCVVHPSQSTTATRDIWGALKIFYSRTHPVLGERRFEAPAEDGDANFMELSATRSWSDTAVGGGRGFSGLKQRGVGGVTVRGKG